MNMSWPVKKKNIRILHILAILAMMCLLFGLLILAQIVCGWRQIQVLDKWLENLNQFKHRFREGEREKRLFVHIQFIFVLSLSFFQNDFNTHLLHESNRSVWSRKEKGHSLKTDQLLFLFCLVLPSFLSSPLLKRSFVDRRSVREQALVTLGPIHRFGLCSMNSSRRNCLSTLAFCAFSTVSDQFVCAFGVCILNFTKKFSTQTFNRTFLR